MSKLSKQEINDLSLMAGERAGRCLLDALQLVDDPEQGTRVIIQANAMMLVVAARFVQELARAEGDAVEWDRCVLALSRAAEEKALTKRIKRTA